MEATGEVAVEDTNVQILIGSLNVYSACVSSTTVWIVSGATLTSKGYPLQMRGLSCTETDYELFMRTHPLAGFYMIHVVYDKQVRTTMYGMFTLVRSS